jgi:predicted RNA-binding protein YlqC (UPF0109 family)
MSVGRPIESRSCEIAATDRSVISTPKASAVAVARAPLLSVPGVKSVAAANRTPCGYWRVHGGAPLKELIEAIAKALVDKTDAVQVRMFEGEQVTVFELRVHPDDLGKVIGRQGRIVNSIRTLLSATGMKERKRFVLNILE